MSLTPTGGSPDDDDDDDLVETARPPLGLERFSLNQLPAKDRIRWYITLTMLIIIGVAVAGAGVAVGFGLLNARNAIELVFTPILTSFAAIIGFYFGDRRG